MDSSFDNRIEISRIPRCISFLSMRAVPGGLCNRKRSLPTCLLQWHRRPRSSGLAASYYTKLGSFIRWPAVYCLAFGMVMPGTNVVALLYFASPGKHHPRQPLSSRSVVNAHPLRSESDGLASSGSTTRYPCAWSHSYRSSSARLHVTPAGLHGKTDKAIASNLT